MSDGVIRGSVIGAPHDLVRESFVVKLVFTSETPANAANTIDPIMHIFARAGSLGMFAGKAFDPARSSVEVTAKGATDSKFSYALEVKAIEIGAFRVLFNMLLRLARLGLPLTELRISSSSDRSTRQA